MRTIRLAQVADAKAMLEIYSHYVETTAISFEEVAPTLEEFTSRVDTILKEYPWLVLEEDGRVVAYAYASAHRARPAYKWSVETTVYVNKGSVRTGAGRAIYERLIAELRSAKFVNLIAGIALPNTASVALHESLGFTQVAKFLGIGFKKGEWWDVGYWQLVLDRPSQPL